MSPSGDVLSEVLGELSLRGEVFCRTRLGPANALSFPPGQAHFHAIERGPCWVTVDRDVPRQAEAGDLLLLAAGSGHAVAAAQPARTVHALWDVVPTHYDADALSLNLCRGEPTVKMICGRFTMDAVGREALVGALPPIVHLKARDQPVDWLASTLRLLSAEATSHRPGSHLARARLVDLILVGALRRWLEEQSEADTGWLAALRDPVVSAALAHLHRRPGHAWTVPELASLVGLSRSPFAERFKAQVGMPPMRYLTSWRMRMALRLLRRGQSVGDVALAVGYASSAAFSRVFKKELGQSPSQLRPPSPTSP